MKNIKSSVFVDLIAGPLWLASIVYLLVLMPLWQFEGLRLLDASTLPLSWHGPAILLMFTVVAAHSIPIFLALKKLSKYLSGR
jgi:hypothetical protein